MNCSSAAPVTTLKQLVLQAFWIFYDLMEKIPMTKQSSTTTPLSLMLFKWQTETAIGVGKIYRSKFPNGDFYSDG